jgi:AraC-like DNA-binding protein
MVSANAPKETKTMTTANNRGRKRKVNHKDVIQWRLQNKASRRKTAEHFGLSAAYVQELWRKAGMSYQSPVPSGGASFRKDWKAIADYRKENRASVTETCRVFGVSRTTVTRACQAHGVNLEVQQ